MASVGDRSSHSGGPSNQFGTFGGVFTPSILTVLGVIMFMRTGFVVGQVGVLYAVLILVTAKCITTLTALSMSAISTNMQVRGCGAYFMISRVLGPDFGGGIGLALYIAQAVSVPFYILGFSEALVRTFPELAPQFQLISMGSAAALLAIAYVGADWAIRTQYIIMTVLGLSILAFMGGAAQSFAPATFTANLGVGYTLIDPGEPAAGSYSYWQIFAIFFPAVTGILAGVNMSGDLRDPARSIPLGTLCAIGVGFIIYLAQILLSGGAFPRQELIGQPYEVLKNNALLGTGFLVAAGVCGATLSSALGSCLGAPRILQAVARDGIIAFLRPFAHGASKGDEPRTALLLTASITFAVLLWAGNDAGGTALNAVAALITMFFLYTYGMTNVAAFIEGFVGNPSFRPTFRLFHWSAALIGAVACVAVAFLINRYAAIGAVLVITALLWYVRTRQLQVTFRDARRGLVYTQVRRGLFRLAQMEDDPKNWRPTILVFSGNPATRESLVAYAVWLEAGRGIVLMANVLVGDLEQHSGRREAAIKQLESFCRDKRLLAFPMVVVARDIEQGVSAVLQGSTVGSIRPNLAAFGWTGDVSQVARLLQRCRQATRLGMSTVLIRAREGPVMPSCRRIDVWWRERRNGQLMVLLAHLLTLNWEWAGGHIRVLREVSAEDGVAPAMQALQEMIDAARVQATAHAIVSDRPFAEVLHEHSRDAGCVFIGFRLPEAAVQERWHSTYEALLEGMPPVVMVHSSGREDMQA